MLVGIVFDRPAGRLVWPPTIPPAPPMAHMRLLLRQDERTCTRSERSSPASFDAVCFLPGLGLEAELALRLRGTEVCLAVMGGFQKGGIAPSYSETEYREKRRLGICVTCVTFMALFLARVARTMPKFCVTPKTYTCRSERPTRARAGARRWVEDDPGGAGARWARRYGARRCVSVSYRRDGAPESRKPASGEPGRAGRG